MSFPAGICPGQTLEEALVPPGATDVRIKVMHDGLMVLYRTASGLREQRRWTIASTTRWPD